MSIFVLNTVLLTAVGQLSLRDGDTVVFAGDSITQAGDYVGYVEAYLLSQRPNENYRFINSGLSSETVSGTSEPDHNPPRPCVHDRFARDLAAHKPNLVVVCYGMNDGNYHPFEEARFGKYQAGMRRLVHRIMNETQARGVIILTPPPFDVQRSVPSDPHAKHFGYKNPSRDYDHTLRKYADWLLTLQENKVAVLDVHRACTKHLAQHRTKDPEYYLAPDAVHPGPTGHWLMAQELIRFWELKPSWSICELDIQKPNHKIRSEGSKWTWEVGPRGLGVELEPRIPESVYRAEHAMCGYARQHLRICHLPAGTYRVQWNDQPLGDFSSKTLQDSIELPVARLRTQGQTSFLEMVMARRKAITQTWLQQRKTLTNVEGGIQSIAEGEANTEQLTAKITELRKPRMATITVERLN